MFVLAGQPVHVCQARCPGHPGPGGCCSDFAESLGRACQVIEECLVKPLPIPALNKWTKLFPTFAHNVLLAHFFDFVSGAFSDLFGQAATAAADGLSSSEDEEAKALGAPVNEMKTWRKLAKLRNLKACFFLSDEESKFMNMLWLVIASPVMKLHWMLFHTATWHSERPAPPADGRGPSAGDEGSDGSRPSELFASFCRLAHNPALKVVSCLVFILRDPAGQLRLVQFWHGPYLEWRQNGSD